MSSPVASTLRNWETVSLKKLAWAYGCAKTGSDEEREPGKMLRERILGEGTSAAGKE